MARSKYEIKGQKELEKKGCQVDWKIQSFRQGKAPKGYNVDFFGCFDLLALCPNGTLRLIAIKGHAGVPKKLRQSIENFTIKRFQKEIWSYGRKGQVRKEIV